MALGQKVTPYSYSPLLGRETQAGPPAGLVCLFLLSPPPATPDAHDCRHIWDFEPFSEDTSDPGPMLSSVATGLQARSSIGLPSPTGQGVVSTEAQDPYTRGLLLECPFLLSLLTRR